MSYAPLYDEFGERLAIGWFGIPDGKRDRDRKTKVHLVDSVGPVCGVPLRDEHEFQWCSWDYWKLLECGNCKKISRSRLRERSDIESMTF